MSVQTDNDNFKNEHISADTTVL